MSDDNNNVVVETTEEVQKTDRAKALKRRSSIGRFLDGVKSLLGLSTDIVDSDEVEEKEVEETKVKEEVAPEDQMDVEVATEDADPEADFGEEDEFLDEGEEVKPDPKLQAIKKMNLSKKEKVALAKQRSEELLEEDIKRVSQEEEEESRSASPERKAPARRVGRPPKKARGRAAAKTPNKTTKKATKAPARSRSASPSKSPSRSRSASPAKKTPAKKAAAKTPKKTPAKSAKSPAKSAKSPAKSSSTSSSSSLSESNSRSRSSSPAKKTPATRKTPAKSTAKSPAKSPRTPRATRNTPAKATQKATPRTVGRKRKAEDPADGESPTKKVKVTRRKSAPAKKEEKKPNVTIAWPSTVLRQSYKGGKTFYSSVTVNGKKFSLGDTIYLISETSNDPYIGIIENLYETKTGRNRAELRWYYKHEETNSSAKPVKGEVYQSDHIDANPIESFVLDRTPVVTHEDKIKEKDLKTYLAKPDHYYYNRFYDHEAKKFHNVSKYL